MKRILGLLLLLGWLMPVAAHCEDYDAVSVNDTINLWVWCSTGAAPNSLHVVVRYQGEAANSVTFSNRTTSAGASSDFVDSLMYNGTKYYYFFDQVSDLDGTKGNGLYTGMVTLFCGVVPNTYKFTFNKIGDEISDYWAATGSALSAIQAQADTLRMNLGMKPNTKSITRYHGSADTIWTFNGADTLMKIVYFHPGDKAGDPPDSTKGVAP